MTFSSVSLSACDVDEVAATAAGVTGLRGAACWRVAGASTGVATGLAEAGAGAEGLTVAVTAGAAWEARALAAGRAFGAEAAAAGFGLSLAHGASLPAGFFAASLARERPWPALGSCVPLRFGGSLAVSLAVPLGCLLGRSLRRVLRGWLGGWLRGSLGSWLGGFLRGVLGRLIGLGQGDAADRQAGHQAYGQTGRSPCGTRKGGHGGSSPRISQLAQDLSVQDLAVFD